MKKTVLKALVVTSIVLASSTVFAGTMLPGTVYSLGTTTPAAFRTSPKVTLTTSLSSGGALAAEWAAITVHASAIDKDKGYAYYSNSTDPGLYSLKKPSATATTGATPSVSSHGSFDPEK